MKHIGYNKSKYVSVRKINYRPVIHFLLFFSTQIENTGRNAF